MTQPQRGFTLVELMIVVAIVGILAATAVVYTQADPVAGGAREVASFLQTARRLAVAHGPVDPAVVAETSITATARVVVNEADGKAYMSLYELVEDTSASPPSAEWVRQASMNFDRGVKVRGVADTANSLGGETVPSQLNGDVEILFYPNGRADAATIYLENRTKANGDKFRVFVMPYAGTATTVKYW